MRTALGLDHGLSGEAQSSVNLNTISGKRRVHP
jgi:hypothetical protein